MKDGLKFVGILDYVVRDKNGKVKDKGRAKNQIQTLLLENVIDAIDTASFTDTALDGMAIGTGTGIGVGGDALSSLSSAEALSGQTQPTAVTLQNVATFTAVTGTITEAGLFDAAACISDMYTYNDGLSIALTSSDSLQITWTITASV